MRDTSAEAYAKLMASGALSRARKLVYSVVYEFGPITQNEVCEIIRQRIGGTQAKNYNKRFSELERQRAIKIVGDRSCEITGMRCNLWDVTDEWPIEFEHQPTLREQLDEAKAEIGLLKLQIPVAPVYQPKDKYLILSLKNSPQNGMAVWWNPGSCGYTLDLSRAGRYTKEEVDSNPRYYNNGITTVAILEELVNGSVFCGVLFETARKLL